MMAGVARNVGGSAFRGFDELAKTARQLSRDTFAPALVDQAGTLKPPRGWGTEADNPGRIPGSNERTIVTIGDAAQGGGIFCLE